MHPFETSLTIGVTGTVGAGKTVFLTSLLNHLLHQDVKEFRLTDRKGKAIELRPRWAAGSDGVLPVRRLKLFPYREWRTQLACGEWPEKTTDFYACRLRLRDTNEHAYNLTFVDWPGERLADGGIADHDFAGWSDAVFRDFDSEGQSVSGDVASYRQYLERDAIDLKTVVAEYKKLLVRVFWQRRPKFSPSTFWLSSEGAELKPLQDAPTPEQLCGLPGAEFGPLTRPARNKHTRIADEAAKNFKKYKCELVSPIFLEIARCDAIICLVDILQVLSCDHHRYLDTQGMLRDLLLYCRPERNWFGRLIDGLAPRAWRNCALKRIAFVASKADLVPEGQQRDRLAGLLNSMTAGLIPSLGVAAGHFTCAGVIATQEYNGKLVGRLRYDKKTSTERPRSEPEVEFTNTKVPEKWPGDWKTGKYMFAEVWPRPMPGRTDLAPQHIDLDRVFSFVLNGEKGAK